MYVRGGGGKAIETMLMEMTRGTVIIFKIIRLGGWRRLSPHIVLILLRPPTGLDGGYLTRGAAALFLSNDKTGF